jgi:hypothetical protein
VASITRRLRSRPFDSISPATPCALKIVTEPAGISSRVSTKRTPRPRKSSSTWRLWTISCSTYTGGP